MAFEYSIRLDSDNCMYVMSHSFIIPKKILLKIFNKFFLLNIWIFKHNKAKLKNTVIKICLFTQNGLQII